MADLNKNIPFYQIVEWFIRWASAELACAGEWTTDDLHALQAKLALANTAHRNLHSNIYNLCNSSGMPEALSEVMRCGMMLEFKEKLTTLVEDLAERIARLQLADLQRELSKSAVPNCKILLSASSENEWQSTR